MGLKYYSREVNNCKEFPSISSNADLPIYANLAFTTKKRRQDSNPQPSSSLETSSHTGPYANIHAYGSVRDQNTLTPVTKMSSVFQTNNYFNISMLSSKRTDQTLDTTYGKLVNTMSVAPLNKTDPSKNLRAIDENNNHRVYENIKLYSSSSKSIETHFSFSNPSSSPSSHTYINHAHQEDTSQIVSSPSAINEEKYIKGHYSTISSFDKKSSDIEPNELETNSNVSTLQMNLILITVKKLEVNMAPNCGDKSSLYRTKILQPLAHIHPAFRQRRTSHRSKRRRRRSTTPFRSTSSNAVRRRKQQQQQQQQKHHSNMTSNVPQPKNAYDRRKHTVKSVSNQLYNVIQQPNVSDNHSFNSVYSDEEIQILDYPKHFHGALQHHVFAWYPTVTYNEDDLIPQVISASENGEPNQQIKIITKKEEEKKQEEEEDEEEEEFLPHDTFEDFLLRRPRKSSSSPTTSSTSTASSIVKPVRPPPLVRRSSGIALGLDKNDVDFIHKIIQRTQGQQRVSNRITALREAYVRAAIKQQNDILKTKAIAPMNPNQTKKSAALKRSLVTSKIHDELERYDELPIHRKAMFHYQSDDDDDDEEEYDRNDDDDDTYSINDDYRFRRRPLPSTPSTAHRILHFITTVKRQLKKSFHDFRSRIVIETMAMSSNHIPRHKYPYHESRRHHASRPKSSHDINHRNTNYHSNEHFQSAHRHQLHRIHSNTSQVQHTHIYPKSEQNISRKRETSRSVPRQPRMTRRN
ncbi:hypothetical protein I4U23_013956 [Adineta vaga]|nr:hypothetical protein I4U23_013956 [Adineta vaga]